MYPMQTPLLIFMIVLLFSPFPFAVDVALGHRSCSVSGSLNCTRVRLRWSPLRLLLLSFGTGKQVCFC
jgi:hypothetical protein